MKKRSYQSIFAILLIVFLLSGCKTEPVAENDATEYSEAIYVCEVVEDITQEESISFENMILYFRLTQTETKDDEVIGYTYYDLCVYEDGRVYYIIEKYEKDYVKHFFTMADDQAWNYIEEAYYLGCMSSSDMGELHNLLNNIDYDSERIDYRENEVVEEPQGDVCLDGNEWTNIGCKLVYQTLDNINQTYIVESRGMEGDCEVLRLQTTDPNALELMHFVEESPFYTTWLELIFEGVE